MSSSTSPAHDRTPLMGQHAKAKARRERAELGSDEYRAAAEEVARIEIAIARLEEPPTPVTPPRPVASAPNAR